jgi:hypothetical protein
MTQARQSLAGARAASGVEAAAAWRGRSRYRRAAAAARAAARREPPAVGRAAATAAAAALRRAALFALAALALLSRPRGASAFSDGDSVLVLRVGSGAAALGANTADVFMDEWRLTGSAWTNIDSTAMPSAASASAP